MSSKSHIRGHEVYYDFAEGTWRYFDDDEKCYSDNERHCPRCERPAGPLSCDACLGLIPGVKSACCGHGGELAWIIYEEQYG